MKTEELLHRPSGWLVADCLKTSARVFFQLYSSPGSILSCSLVGEMSRNRDVRFVSSSVKISRYSANIVHKNSSLFLEERGGFSPIIFGTHLPFARQNISVHLQRARDAIQKLVSSSRSLSLLFPPFSPKVARAETEPPGNYPRRNVKEDEERILISEVLIRNKDGEELEREDLAVEAAAALKSCRPNSALTLREVQEDVHRIIESGYFFSCMPVAVDTRDGIRLVFQVILRIVQNFWEIFDWFA